MSYRLGFIYLLTSVATATLAVEDLVDEGTAATALELDGECDAEGKSADCTLNALQQAARIHKGQKGDHSHGHCLDHALVGHWKAQAHLSFLKSPLQINLHVSTKPQKDGHGCHYLFAKMQVPGQEFPYDVRGLRWDKHTGLVHFRFQNNKAKKPYWHPGVYDPKRKVITEHLDQVGDVRTHHVQTGTGGVMGIKQFVFHKR
eukprot:TRINITY_DN8573_c0_g1_i1.p1 TRINITY_DN8573_c0_g1~~TRINITY_DN8573_c0_g1_i1.p1  ORF type:complete len:202 (+),score=19.12 TRINITY_DN8573_c0_g1_i1:87-692(+)